MARDVAQDLALSLLKKEDDAYKKPLAEAKVMAGERITVYDRSRQRHEGYEPDDYIFFPQFKNRMTASKVVQRQFHTLMERAGVEVDQATGRKLTMYSLRHTAICMRIILSHGRVNIFNLAKNAGTSVDQIERFYARFLPLSKEMALNLQSFGGQEKPLIGYRSAPVPNLMVCICINIRSE